MSELSEGDWEQVSTTVTQVSRIILYGRLHGVHNSLFQFLNEMSRYRSRFVHELVKASRKGDLNEVKRLCEAGVSLNATANSVTPLHAAVAHDQVDCAEFLLKYGAGVEQRIADQITPLHVASRFDNLASVVLLTRYGADVNAVNGEEWTPLHLAARNGNSKCLKVLISVGAELNPYLRPSKTSPGDKLTPLHFAARHGHVECVQMLLKFRADVNIQSGSSESSALHMAVSQKHLPCVLALILHGAALDAKDCCGDSPLHLAAREGSAEIVEVLLQAGANLTLLNNAQKTAAQVGNKALRERLSSLDGKPQSLVFLSALAIKKSFPVSGCLENFVCPLPLPSILKEKLLLRGRMRYI